MTMHALMLNACGRINSERIWATDLDGTVFEDLMALVVARFIGVKRKAVLDHLLRSGSLTQAEFLCTCVNEMCQIATDEEVLQCYLSHARLIPGFADFRLCLDDWGVSPLGLTNNIGSFAAAVLSYLNVEFPVVGNGLSNGRFSVIHPDIAFDKGEAIRWLDQHGKTVVGFAGDSSGDHEAAIATRKLGGAVVVVGDGTSQLNGLASFRISSYTELLPYVPNLLTKGPA